MATPNDAHDLGPTIVHTKELFSVDIDSPLPGSRLTEIDRPFEAQIFDHKIDTIVTESGYLALTTELDDTSRLAVHMGLRELYSLQYLSREEAWIVFGDDGAASELIRAGVRRDVTLE